MINLMDKNPKDIIIAATIIIFIIGFVLGWVFAHGAVAAECRKLGSFYIAENIFECKLKAKSDA